MLHHANKSCYNAEYMLGVLTNSYDVRNAKNDIFIFSNHFNLVQVRVTHPGTTWHEVGIQRLWALCTYTFNIDQPKSNELHCQC